MTSLAENPLLQWGTIPDYTQIQAEHVGPAIAETLKQSREALAALEAKAATLSLEDLVAEVEQIGDRLSWTWGIANHLNAVRSDDAIRGAIAENQAEVVRFSSEFGQSEALYAAYNGAEAPSDPALRRTRELAIRDMVHAGVGLEGEARERFNDNAQALAKLGLGFQNALLDATKAWSLLLKDEAEVAGLPPSLLGAMAQSAAEHGEEGASAEAGPWRLSLDPTIVRPFLEYAERRDLRETAYRALVGRAGPEGPAEHDNSGRIVEILKLRQAQAELLGFPHYAALSIDAKMAPSVEAAEALLTQLHEKSAPAAEAEMEELRAFAAAEGAEEALALWDVAYWARLQQEKRYAYSEEELKPYFAYPKVLSGLFSLVEDLFGVTFRQAERPGWHPDVSYYEALEGERVIAGFFIDPYSRPANKRGGAWMNELRSRSNILQPQEETGIRTPIAYIVCNQAAPIGDAPSLMTWSEVQTLFHEMGHALQHMLTRVERASVAGISGIEWDAVELPSQFMENWLRLPEVLDGFARHYETDAPIDPDLLQRVLDSATFRAGSGFLRQLYFGRLDLALHSGYDPDKDGTIWEVQRQIAAENTIIKPLDDDRFLCSFGHLFAGGYAAGYYSYKWAEVLSADAFAAFEEAGLEDAAARQEVGKRFRDTILALGGSVTPMEAFVAFRDREPDVTPLLRHNGLVA